MKMCHLILKCMGIEWPSLIYWLLKVSMRMPFIKYVLIYIQMPQCLTSIYEIARNP